MLAFAVMLPTVALNVGAAMASIPTAAPDRYEITEGETLVVGSDWLLDGWSARRQIKLDDAGTDGPLTIRIDPTSIDYSRTSELGRDVRFVGAEGEAIGHEVTSWVAGGESLVVLLPEPNGERSVVWMYYGNPHAPELPDSVEPSETHDAVEPAAVAIGPEELSGVLANDSSDGPVVASLESGPTSAASFALNSNGSLVYTPAAGFIGEDTFSYRAVSASAVGEPTTVTIDILPIPEALVVEDDVPILSEPDPDTLFFESPEGQPSSEIDFTAEGHGYNVILSRGEAMLTVGNGNSKHEVAMGYRDGASDPEPAGIDPLTSTTATQRYASISYRDIYPGIDVAYEADGKELEYSFTVHPGSDPSQIAIEFSGARGMEVKDDGTLLVDSQAGRDLKTTAPYTYQEIAGERVEIESSYVLKDEGTVGFTIGSYDPTVALVIDPTFKAVDTAGGDASSITITKPAGVVEGDFMLAQILVEKGGVTFTAPADWTLLREDDSSSDALAQALFYRVAGASEPADYTFSFDQAAKVAGAIGLFTDVDTANPVDAHSGQASSGGDPTAPSITTTVAGTQLVALFGMSGVSTFTPPVGMTERWDFNPGDNPSISGAEETFAGIGATGSRTATGTSANKSISQLIALAPAPLEGVPMAVWRRDGVNTPFAADWDGSGFGGAQPSQSVGDFRIIQGAESPSRDEAIIVGVDAGGTVAGELWNGSSWTALPVLGSTTQTYWWGFDVAYEPVSGDAMVVYADGAALNYRTWNGSTWSGETAIAEPLAGTPRQMQLASHPYSDEMVLVVSDDTSRDYALVWNGSAWGNSQILTADGTGNDRTDINVVYEQKRGRALVVFGTGTDDVHFRVWDAGWSNEFSTPGLGGGYAQWVVLGADPNSNNVAMGVLTNDSDVWLAVWDGAGWVNRTTATTSSTGVTEPAVAVAFEGSSGSAIAAYGESVATPRYRTWVSGSGWTGELSAPNIGGTSNSMALYPEPGTNGAILAVNDDGGGINYVYWNGTAWGSPSELETASGETKNQPFLFLWEGTVGTAPPESTISGTVFEDTIGDVLNDGVIGDVRNPGAENVDVYLYLDDGDANLDAGDTLIGGAPTQTLWDGTYSFTGLADGDYFVVVDSKTVAPSQDVDAIQTDIWAEQTYGPTGAYCDNGIGYSITASAGPCYGGIAGHLSDDFSQWDDREHRAAVTLSGGSVLNVDFGFSFNVVVNTTSGGTEDWDLATNRTVQGSLRQFIQNANAIAGPNAMRFVPVDPAGATDGTNDWWRIMVTEVLPPITGDGTTIDGRAYDFTDGATVLDTNAAQIGAGATVGTEGTYTTPQLDPELEIRNYRPTAVVPTGLVFEANDSVLRHVSIWGFGDSATSFDTNVRMGTTFNTDPDFTGSLVEFNVIGTGPASFTDPGVDDRSGNLNLAMRETDNAFVQDNLIGFGGGAGVTFSTASNSGTVLRNEIRRNGILNPSGNPVGVWISGNVTGNLITDNASGVYSGPTLWITYQDNTISANGWGASRPDGIWVSGSFVTIERNVIADNVGAGVVVPSSTDDAYVTRNGFSGNGAGSGQIGIDLLATGDDPLATPFVTLNDDGDFDIGGNGLLNYPIIQDASIQGGELSVTGWARPGSNIEFYLADPDPTGFGEGQKWLVTKTEGSGDDLDSGTGTYGPSPVNGIAQGTDTTNRFEFAIPLASLTTVVAASDGVTALATVGSATSEFSGVVALSGPIVVNSTGDAGDDNLGDGLCETAILGECTLRAAIEEANNTPGTDTIEFNIPTSDPGYTASPLSYTIQIGVASGTTLPAITDPVTIDGSTQPDFPGTPVIVLDGTAASASDPNGLTLQAGDSTIRGLVIVDSGDDAIEIETNGGNSITGNYIGVGVDGTTPQPNKYGVSVKTNGNTIGGTNAGDRNIISGNTNYGLAIYNAASGNFVQGNYIGVAANGSSARGNGASGIEVLGGANSNTIGGTATGAGNVISGNANYGIDITGIGTDSNDVIGNYVGTDASGTADLGNSLDGVVIRNGAQSNIVGGATAADRNIISGNDNDGLWITGTGTSANEVRGNWIGFGSDGSSLGNAYHGVAVENDANGNLVGGIQVGTGNRIGNSGWDGIAVDVGPGLDNTLLGNAISNNGDLGIDLASDGVTLNDPGDAALNFPEITAARESGGFVSVDFNLEVPLGWYRIEFFANPSGADGSGYGEGENIVGSMAVNHGGGVRSFGTSFLGSAGDVITATATECTTGSSCTVPGSTSEFSAAVTVTLNQAPVATDDPPAGSYQVNEGGWAMWAVMGNDSDPDGDTLYLDSFTQPSIGTVTRMDGGTPADTSDDTLRYDAPVDTTGPTSFTYTISDGVLTDVATVLINVKLLNEYPVFDQDLLDRTDAEGALISISAGATDADTGDALTYSATDLPIGLAIESGSGLIAGLVNHAAAAYSPYSTEITVCDDGSPSRCDTDTLTWTITNVVTTSPYLVAGTGGVGGGDDLLTTVNPTDFDPTTNEVDIGTGTGTSGIESEGIQPVSGVLFTVDGDQLGILNTDHGAFTTVGTGLGTGDGPFGAIAFDNVTGMAFHPLTGIIWAVHSRSGLVDALFLIDPDTGNHIPDVFGSGRDYQILRQHAGATDFTGLAFDPTDWQLYGVLTDGAGTDYLVSITRKNGNSKVVGTLAQPITDLSFDDFGQMWGVDAGTLYQINKTSGALDGGRTIDNGADYGAVAFAVSPASPPALEGVVFEDLAGDALAGSQAVEDISNPGVGGVTVSIYRDNGAIPGEPDPTDTLFDSKITGPTGHYFFEAVPGGSVYWLTVDSTTLNPTAGGTGWAEQTYGPVGAVTYQAGSYSVAASAGPLFGGQRATRSDSPIDASTSEHVARLDLVALDYVEDMDFGFSFNAVTNLEGAGASFEQGSLRQFISNANTATGPNAMRFVPVVPPNDGTSSWWSLAPSVALPAITGAGTAIDGTAYDASDGVTVLNPNPAGPEFELRGPGAAGYGLEVSADNSEVRGVVINRFATGIALLGGDASVIAGNYLGLDATGLVGEVGNSAQGILVYGATNTVIGGRLPPTAT